MKRTKETFFRYHPHPAEREGVSGCKEFDGEDLYYDSRNQYYKDQQANWVNQQRQERDWKDEQERYDEHLHAKQMHETNRMRQMLEENFKQKKQSIQCTHKEENLILAQQKKDKEESEKAERIRQEQEEVRIMLERGRKKQYIPPQ